MNHESIHSPLKMREDHKKGWVSVIIPTWNRATLLPFTLNSILAQEYRPIEIVLIDDGSTDHTTEIVNSFKKQTINGEIEIQFLQQKRKGASNARSYALENCQGEFIQFLDSDDLIHPDKLWKQVEAIKSNSADFVWSASIKFTDQPNWEKEPFIGTALPENISIPEVIISFIIKGLWRTESGLYRRETCQRTGPWNTLAMFQDWDYNIRMLAWKPKIKQVPGTFTAARQHDLGRIGDGWTKSNGLTGALQAVKLVENHTGKTCEFSNEWLSAVRERYQEIFDQASLFNYQKVKELAKKELIRFDNKFNQVIQT